MRIKMLIWLAYLRIIQPYMDERGEPQYYFQYKNPFAWVFLLVWCTFAGVYTMFETGYGVVSSSYKQAKRLKTGTKTPVL